MPKIPTVSDKIKVAVVSPTSEPVWKGPEVDGVSSSLLQRFLGDPERFRLLTIEGLRSPERFSKYLEFGNMWHICEEQFALLPDAEATQLDGFLQPLEEYAAKLLNKYPYDRDEVAKWYNVIRVQFPVYVKYWKDHPDIVARTPIESEKVFEVDYPLPNGRVVKLKGKRDSVDLVEKGNQDVHTGIWLQENKTKSEVDEAALRKQLKFDLQTMLYLVSLYQDTGSDKIEELKERYSIIGVRYNVIRRPLSGGAGTIRMHKVKMKKGLVTEPAETEEQFYNRLKTEYIEAEPQSYFYRWNCEVSLQDLKKYKERFLDPILTSLCTWYDWVTSCKKEGKSPFSDAGGAGIHYQHPYGVRNLLDEGGSTEYDGMLETGSEAGLSRTTNLFPELS